MKPKLEGEKAKDLEKFAAYAYNKPRRKSVPGTRL